MVTSPMYRAVPVNAAAAAAADAAGALEVEAAPAPSRGPVEGGTAPPPERRSHWTKTALLLLADIVGTGVLSLPGAVRRLGPAPGFTWLCLCIPLNVATGLLLWRVRYGLPDVQSAGAATHPSTYGDLFLALFGEGHWLPSAAYAMVYSYIFLALGEYFLVLAKSIQHTFFMADLCRPAAGVIGALLLLFTNQLRTLDGVAVLSIFGGITIFIVLAICIAVIVSDDSEGADDEHASGGGDLLTVTPTLSAFLFACGGQKVYLEMMAEMNNLADFPKALAVAASTMAALYIAIAVISNAYLGSASPDYILDVLPFNWIRVVANLCMIVHMIGAFTLGQQIVSRAIHAKLSPARVNVLEPSEPSERGRRQSNARLLDFARCMARWSGLEDFEKARVEWAGITTCVMLLCFTLAESVPRFTDFVELLGAAFASILSFGMPVLLYWRYVTLTGRGFTTLEVAGIAMYALITFYFMLLGTASVMRNIVMHDAKTKPWSCQCASEACEMEAT